MQVVKRDGRTVPYDRQKIKEAIAKAFQAVKPDVDNNLSIIDVTDQVNMKLMYSQKVTIEEIQDLVEKALMERHYYEVAKAYILYRDKRAQERLRASTTKKPAETEEDAEFKELCAKNSVAFGNNPMREFVYMRTYSRWIERKGRREIWSETIDRYVQFLRAKIGPKLSDTDYEDIRQYIFDQKVMPSMRLLQFAGPAASRCNVCVYNCAFSAPACFKDLADIMYLSMSGTGVGFSVEEKNVAKFPNIMPSNGFNIHMIIDDSKEGWCDALQFGLIKWFEGTKVVFDYSRLRPAGARLKTMGGRSSGPKPLMDLMNFTEEIIEKRRGTTHRLSTLDVHDIICKIGQIVVSGGVRRCIAEGSKVITYNNSFKSIEEIVPGDHVLTIGGWKPVVRTFDQGVQALVRIEHQEGYLECTPNHRVAVFTNMNSDYVWKNASELVKGDILGFPVRDKIGQPFIQSPGINQMPTFFYAKPAHSTTCKDITIPPLDDGTAWLIGNFQGDGYVLLTPKSGELSIAIHGDEIDQKNYTEIQLRRFGVNTGLTAPSKKDFCFKVRVKSKQLAVFFHTHVKQAKTPLRVPEFIKMASPRIKACFIQGLMDADGSVKNRPILVVTTVYPEYAMEIQALFMSIGIITRMKSRPVTVEGWQDKYEIALINNRDKRAFMQMTAGMGFKKCSFDGKPQNANGWNVSKITFSPDFPEPPQWTTKVDRSLTKDVNVPLDSLEQYFRISSKVVPIKVKSVVVCEQPKRTYDIEVEDNHNFVCSGVLVHNSALISISDFADQSVRDCKKGNFWLTDTQRCLANNSAAYDQKPDQLTFMKEWISLAESGTGERGIFNRGSLSKVLPQRRVDLVGDKVGSFGMNPCVTADAWIQTVEGPRQVKDLIGKKVDLVVNGKAYPMESTGFFHTGDKQVYEVQTWCGYFVTITEDHPLLEYKTQKWTTLKELKDSPVYGQQICLSNHSGLLKWPGRYTFEQGQADSHHGLCDEDTSSEYHRGYLSEFFMIWGDKTHVLDVCAEYSDQQIILSVQRMLIRVGIISDIRSGSEKGKWNIRVIGGQSKLFRFLFWGEGEKPTEDFSSSIFADRIESITKLGIEPVYDVTVAEVHEFCANGLRLHNCGEVLLQPFQFCNLTEVVLRAEDTFEQVKKKMRVATLIGTCQAYFCDFKYIDPKWRENQEAERLLGVSLTGIYDRAPMSATELQELRDSSIQWNREYAKKLGINPATAITVVKPSGTVSQMVDSASGIHPRFAEYYIRRIRIGSTDPLLQFMKDQGYPCLPEVGQSEPNVSTYVLEFVVQAPTGSSTVKNFTALEQLETWLHYKRNYTEHNPSVTIYVKADEWLAIGNWVWNNWDYITGLSFLPYSDHIYELAPYEAISEEKFLALSSKIKKVDFSKLRYYEKEDTTDVKKEVACAGGVCEL